MASSMNELVGAYIFGFFSPLVLFAFGGLCFYIIGLFSKSNTFYGACPHCEDAGVRLVLRSSGDHLYITEIYDSLRHRLIARFNKKHRESWQKAYDKKPWTTAKNQRKYGTK